MDEQKPNKNGNCNNLNFNTEQDFRMCMFQMVNHGEKYSHFVISVGYDDQQQTQDDVELVLGVVLELFGKLEFPYLMALDYVETGGCEIHIWLGMIDIYGETWYAQNMNTCKIEQYITETTHVSVRVKVTD